MTSGPCRAISTANADSSRSLAKRASSAVSDSPSGCSFFCKTVVRRSLTYRYEAKPQVRHHAPNHNVYASTAADSKKQKRICPNQGIYGEAASQEAERHDGSRSRFLS